MQSSFRGAVDAEGRLSLDNRQTFLAHLKTMAGRRVWVSVEDAKPVRSLAQNSYLWGVVYNLIAQHTGHTAEEIHDIMRSKFLVSHTDFKGERIQVIRSTTSLSTADFTDYVEKCRLFASEELGVNVPLPNEIEL